MAYLEFKAGGSKGQTFDLNEGGVVLGRDPACDLVIEDTKVSGRHGQLCKDNGSWVLDDLDSSNGTMVNGVEVKSYRLSDGDTVHIGDAVLVFRNGEEIPMEKAASESTGSKGHKSRSSPRKDMEASEEDMELVRKMRDQTDWIRREVGKTIIGQREVLDQVLMCMMARGHALLIGLPGLAKTLMIHTISQVLDLAFKRIQFTPDLMPSDITGTEVLATDAETREKEFRFVPGPIFSNIILADEINRTPPKTQAALLEAMQEKHVTVGNVSHELELPFFVLATQNPIEQEGTYPLPEAQMDRFMFNIWVDYPMEDEEEEIVRATTVAGREEPGKILSRDDVLHLQKVVAKVPVSEHVLKYAIRLTRSTRPDDERAPDFIKEYVSVGAGPRAGQYLVLAGKARAVLEGRIHVGCNDIRHAAIPVLRHRIFSNFSADSEGLTSTKLIDELLDEVEEPGENDYV